MNYLDFFRSRIADLPSPNERGEVVVRCIFHKDDSPSLSINVENGKFRCFAPHCPAYRGGNYKRFDDFVKGSIPGVLVTDEPIPAQVIEGYHAILLADSSRLAWLRDRRGLSEATLREYRIGWDSDRFTIPVRERDEIVNIRKYKPEAKNDKVINHGTGHGRPRLFPEVGSVGPVYLLEGEMDTLLARQLGYPGHTVTSGAGQWHSSLDASLQGRDVYIVYDMDKAGVNGANVIAQRLVKVAASVRIVSLPLPGTHEMKDFSNLFHDRKVDVDQSRAEFAKALEEARLVIAEVQEVREPAQEIIDIHLSEIGRERFVGHRVRSTVLVAGKDLAPFQVPKCISYACEGGEKICGRCGINRAGLQLKVEFKEWSPELLQMVNVPIEKLDAVIAQAADVPFKCRKFTHEVKEYANVESIKAIPEVDFTSEQSTYVIRNLFYLGHGIETNKTYIIEAVVGPEPKTQYATALIYKSTPAEDTIEKFEMNNAMLERLSVFKV